MRNNVLLLLVLHVVSLNAQFYDSFDDGDHVANPKWLGNNSLFTVDPQNKLRLNAPAGGLAYLYTELVYPDSFVATAELSMEFSPSTTNFTRIYFMSNHKDPGLGNAYFIQAGENGSNDALHLYKSEWGVISLLASGTPGAMAGDPSTVSLKIVYQNLGEITVWADYNLDGSFEDRFSATDAMLLPSQASYFGIQCTFTTSRKDKFVFDNLGVSLYQVDTSPPALTSSKVVNPFTVALGFSEVLDENSALDKNNYHINAAFFPDSVYWGQSRDKVFLQFDNPLPASVPFELTVAALNDLAGNTLTSYTTTLEYFRAPVVGELVLSEILFDPYVNHDDFIEVYNAGTVGISLDSLLISNPMNGQKQWINDPAPLQPGSYRAYTPNADQLRQTYATAATADIRFNALPAFNNDKGAVVISNASGHILDSFYYNQQFQTIDPDIKNQEGVSLEKMQILTFQNHPSNWLSGDSSTLYASPGYESAHRLDQLAPKLIHAEALDSQTVLLTFDDFMNRISAQQIGNIGFADNTPEVENADVALFNSRMIVVKLAEPLSAHSPYLLSIQGLTDKNNNIIRDTTISLLYGVSPDVGDLVLSEVLFYPNSGGFDFIELYNASDRAIQLKNTALANLDNNSEEVVSSSYVLKAGEYVALCEDTTALKNQYPVPAHARFLQTEIPPLNADEGIIQVMNSDGEILDTFSYHEDRHHPLIDSEDRKGVSLERIRLKNFDNSTFNWHSGARAGGFASPGYTNSNQLIQGLVQDQILSYEKVFSPNGDGLADVLIMEYQLEKPGFLLSLEVYSTEGYKVKKLTNNELLGTHGVLTWDGTNDNGLPERMGIYILVASFFHPDGDRYLLKKDCVLADFID